MSTRKCLSCGHAEPHDQQRGFCRHSGCDCDGPMYASEKCDYCGPCAEHKGGPAHVSATPDASSVDTDESEEG